MTVWTVTKASWRTHGKRTYRKIKTGCYQSTKLLFSAHFTVWPTAVKSSSTSLNKPGKAFFNLKAGKLCRQYKEDLLLGWTVMALVALTLLMSSLAALSTTGPISTSVKTLDSATHQRRTSAPYGGSLVWSWGQTGKHRAMEYPAGRDS